MQACAYASNESIYLSVCLSVRLLVHPSICLSFWLTLSNFVNTIREDPASPSYTERSRIFEQTDPKLALSRVVIYSNFGYLNRLALIPGGRGYSIFFLIRRLEPSIYVSHQKNSRISRTPKNIWNFSSPKISPFLYLDLKKKTLEYIEMTPKYSPILWWPSKNIHKIFKPPKNIHFSENPQK